MSRFDRYMLSQLMVVFGFFSLVLVSIYWVNSAVRLFDRLISDGQSVWLFLEMSALTLPNVISQMLPVAAFVAVIFTTNRMSNESELVVMQATGFSPFRMARPVVTFGIIVALVTLVLTNLMVPLSKTRLNERNLEISQNISSHFLNEGQFMHPADGVTLYIRKITSEGAMEDIFLSDRRTKGTETTYTAQRAFLARTDTGPKLVMVSGMAQSYQSADATLSQTRFNDFTYDISGLIAQKGPRPPSLEERSTPALFRADKQMLAETGATRSDALFTAHSRLTKPLLALALALVGFALMQSGHFTRFGKWRQIATAAAAFLVLFLLSNATDKLAQDRGIVALAYLPFLIGLVAAGALLARSAGSRRPARIRQTGSEAPA